MIKFFIPVVKFPLYMYKNYIAIFGSTCAILTHF